MEPQLPEAIGKTMNDEELEALIRATGTEGYPSDVLRLVEAVRSAEREACAAICDQRKLITPEWQMDQHYNQAASHCAQAIRLRGRA